MGQKQAQKKSNKSATKKAQKQNGGQKKKPKKVKKLELITDSEKLENHEHYEYSHTIKTKSSQSMGQKQAKKKSNKSVAKKVSEQVKKKEKEQEEIAKLKKLIDIAKQADEQGWLYLDIEANESIQRKKNKTSSDKKENSKTQKKSKEELKILGDSNDSIQKRENIRDLINKVNSKSKAKSEEELKKLGVAYHSETNRRPFYAGKKTEGFKKWMQQREQEKTKKEKKKEEVNEEWEELLKKWINEADEGEISKEQKKKLYQIIDKYRKFRRIYSLLSILLKKFRDENITQTEIRILLKLAIQVEKISSVEKEFFENLYTFALVYEKNIILYPHLVEEHREKFTRHLAQKLEKLDKEDDTHERKEEWVDVLLNHIQTILDEEISQDSKEELTYIIKNYGKLQKASKNLPPNLKQIIEELEQFQATYSVYKERGYKKSIPPLVNNVVKKLRKSLELFKNEAILKTFLNKENEEGVSFEKIPNVDNWRELLKANLYKITILTLKEKSQINNLIQKENLSEEDKKRIISFVSKLKNEELIALFGKSFEDYIHWGNKWYEAPDEEESINLERNTSEYRREISNKYIKNVLISIDKILVNNLILKNLKKSDIKLKAKEILEVALENGLTYRELRPSGNPGFLALTLVYYALLLLGTNKYDNKKINARLILRKSNLPEDENGKYIITFPYGIRIKLNIKRTEPAYFFNFLSEKDKLKIPKEFSPTVRKDAKELQKHYEEKLLSYIERISSWFPKSDLLIKIAKKIWKDGIKNSFSFEKIPKGKRGPSRLGAVIVFLSLKHKEFPFQNS